MKNKITILLFCILPPIYPSQQPSCQKQNDPPIHNWDPSQKRILTTTKATSATSKHTTPWIQYDDEDIIFYDPEHGICPMDAPSTLTYPILTRTHQLLMQPCTFSTTKQTILTIDPNIAHKSNDALFNTRLSVPQQLALHALIEKLLQRCDHIIQQPHHNLTKPKPFPTLPTLNALSSHLKTPFMSQMIKKCTAIPSNNIELKPLCAFNYDQTKLTFIKHYYLINKAQNDQFKLPDPFDYERFKTTTRYDVFFEPTYNAHEYNTSSTNESDTSSSNESDTSSSNESDTSSSNESDTSSSNGSDTSSPRSKTQRCPINLWISRLLCKLAKTADTLDARPPQEI